MMSLTNLANLARENADVCSKNIVVSFGENESILKLILIFVSLEVHFDIIYTIFMHIMFTLKLGRRVEID